MAPKGGAEISWEHDAVAHLQTSRVQGYGKVFWSAEASTHRGVGNVIPQS